MKRQTACCLAAVALFTIGCSSGGDSAGSASAAVSAAPQVTASATASASAAAAPAIDLTVLGGPDWKAAFTGPAPEKLPDSMGGGRGTGMADDYTRVTSHMGEPWKYNNAGGGGIHWSPTKKAAAVTNINLKLDATPKAVDLWIKSALVRDVKHVGEPELLEVGETKALVKAGAGTCKMQGGEDADFYWWDQYSVGDFAHQLMIVIVAKDAPEDEKKIALSILRQVSYTDKAKPHFKR